MGFQIASGWNNNRWIDTEMPRYIEGVQTTKRQQRNINEPNDNKKLIELNDDNNKQSSLYILRFSTFSVLLWLVGMDFVVVEASSKYAE